MTEQPLMVRGTSVYNGQPIVRILPLATFVLDISHAYCLLYIVTNSIRIAPFFYFYMCKSLFTTQAALCSILPNQMGELIATCNTDGIFCTSATSIFFFNISIIFNFFFCSILLSRWAHPCVPSIPPDQLLACWQVSIVLSLYL